VFAYKYDTAARKFTQVEHFCSTPNDSQGGVWQGGHGIASDGKYLYFATGNGNYDPSKNAYGMAVIKMTPSFEIADYFVPSHWKGFSSGDQDVGSCGPSLIPNTNYLVVGITKYGSVHLINTNNMGKWNATADSCRQTIALETGRITFPGGNPVVWNSGGGKSKIYMWGPELKLTQLEFNAATELIAVPYVTWQNGPTTGGGLFVSSSGSNNAVLWAYAMDGMLYAFDASVDISAGPIWSMKSPGGGAPHWMWPTVVNGKLFIPGGNQHIYAMGVKA